MPHPNVISDRDIRRHFKLMTLTALGAAALLCIFVLVVMHVMQLVFESSYRAQIDAYASEFSLAVEKQSSGDLKTINTLGQFIRSGDDLTDRYVRSRQNYNDFETIGFWGITGMSSQISLSGITTYSHFNNLSPEVQQAVIAAWNGKLNISAPYYDQRLGAACIVYAAPVHDDADAIIGAITATKALRTFDQLLTQLNISLPNVSLFLVNVTGDVLANNSNIFDVTHLDNLQSSGVLDADLRAAVNQSLQSGRAYHADFVYQDQDYSITLSPLHYQGWFTAYIDHHDMQAAPIYSSMLTLVQILLSVLVLLVIAGGAVFFTMRRSYLKQLSLAYYDPLTQAYNLRRFSLELHKILRSDPAEYSLISLEVRDFHFISEYLGEHDYSSLLVLISRSLGQLPHMSLSCRSENAHFYVLLKDTDAERIEQELTEKFDSISAEFERRLSLFPLIFSAGAVRGHRGDDDKLLRSRADFALHQIPRGYAHAIRFYDEQSYQSELKLKQLEHDMRPALANDEFKLFLQPKFDLHTRRITAAEALVRWIKPDGTMIFPGDFIPLFERNGFCAELDLYIFEQVCRQIRKWIDEGRTPLKISVNQSKLLLFRPNYIELVQNLIQRYAIPAHCIIIEILESIMAQDLLELNDYIKRLRAIGLSVSMDDFGAGYSSLNVLSALEIDEIKFDKEFLLETDQEKKEKNKLILTHLLRLAQQFNAQTVVEGVESADDVAFLQEKGCTLAQGFYFNKPIDLKTFDELYMQSPMS